VIGFTTAELLGDGARLPPQVALVGPSFQRRTETTGFPWHQLDAARPLVLISLGTVNADAGRRFLTEAMSAVAELPVQAVVVAPDSVVPAPPPNVIRRDFVPQLALLERASAVVCHAGHNTVAESLAHGVPLVVAPIKDDQPIVAEEVERAGAGVRVKFGRVKADGLRRAIVAALHDESIRAAAERIRRSFEQAGGAARAATLLEELL
jgi:MGT family glycosyltransferase